jgi:hypothetical protein
MTGVPIQNIIVYNNITQNSPKDLHRLFTVKITQIKEDYHGWFTVTVTELNDELYGRPTMNITKENKRMASTLLPVVVYVVILMVLGIIGNLVVCYIYIFRWKKKTLKYFIGTLAAYDFITSIVCMPIEIAMLRNPVTLTLNDPNLCKFVRFIRFTTSSGAGLMLLIIAVDRYRRICKISRPQIQVPLSKKLCFMTAGIGLLFSWPCLILFGQFDRSKSLVARTSCTVDRSFKGTPYPAIYHGIMSVLFVFISLCLLTFYSLILTKLCKMPVLTKVKTLNSGNKIHATNITPTSSSTEGFTCDSTKPSTGLPVDCSNDKATPLSFNDETSHQRQSSSSEGKLFRISPRTQSSIPLQMKKTSFMLFAITLIQWLSFLPYFALLFTASINKDFLLTLSEVDQVFYNIGLVTHYLSSGINPYLYGFLGRDFKKECKKAIMSLKNVRRN